MKTVEDWIDYYIDKAPTLGDFIKEIQDDAIKCEVIENKTETQD